MTWLSFGILCYIVLGSCLYIQRITTGPNGRDFVFNDILKMALFGIFWPAFLVLALSIVNPVIIKRNLREK